MNKRKPSMLLFAILLGGISNGVPAVTLKIYNWKNYIDTSLISQFENQTGITVEMTEFTTITQLESVLAGANDYDIVVPSHFQLPSLIDSGRLEKLNISKLPNHDEIDNSLLAALAAFQRADEFVIPYLWTAVGVAYDKPMVDRALGRAAPQSWSLIFYDENLKQLSNCGVGWLDASKELFSLKANLVGVQLAHSSERRIRTYAGALDRSVKYIKAINNEAYIDELASGDLCAAMAWAGHALTAMEKRETLSFIVPKEGGLLTIDSWAIMKDSDAKNEAYQFINFMLAPQSGRRNASATKFFSHLPPSTSTRQGVGLNPKEVLGEDYRHKLYFVENVGSSQSEFMESHLRSLKANLQSRRN